MYKFFKETSGWKTIAGLIAYSFWVLFTLSSGKMSVYTAGQDLAIAFTVLGIRGAMELLPEKFVNAFLKYAPDIMQIVLQYVPKELIEKVVTQIGSVVAAQLQQVSVNQQTDQTKPMTLTLQTVNGDVHTFSIPPVAGSQQNQLQIEQQINPTQ